MSTLKIKETISDLYKYSFINKFILFLTDLYEESFINKVLNLIRKSYYDSFIYSVLKREDEEISVNFKFFKINYFGNYKNVLIFLIIASIPFILKLNSLYIKIAILLILYFIFITILVDEDLVKESFLYKIFEGKDE